MKTKKAIIIGAGVAGLATAVRLAIKGFEVVVYEKNNYVGGKLSAFEKQGYLFDAGPSLFTSPQLLEQLFKDAGEPIEDYFLYESLPIACKYFYEDGIEINAFTNSELFAKELSEKLDENSTQIINYLSQSKKLYNKTGLFFLTHSLHKIKSYFSKKLMQAFVGAKAKYLFKNLNRIQHKPILKILKTSPVV